MTMSVSLAPPSSGGRGTFSVAAWNICCGRGNGLTFATKGLAKMGVGCVILSEMKVTDDRYTRTTSGYKVLSTKAPSKHKRNNPRLINSLIQQTFALQLFVRFAIFITERSMFQHGQYILMESHSQSPQLFNILTSSILIDQLDTAVAFT
jgi:hypothetical protein